MEFQQLKYFLEVVKEGNITKAAESLHIAQPALSQSIKRLEAEIGFPLFDRKGKRIKINSLGEAIAKRIQQPLFLLDTLPEYASTVQATGMHTIKLNVQSASQLITQVIIAFREEFPEINLSASQNPKSDDWHIKITSGNIFENDEDRIAVLDEEIFLAVPINWKLKNSDYADLVEFSNAPFIVLSTQSPFQLMCEDYLKRAGISPVIAFQSDSPAAVRDLISAGLGVAFWPLFSWAPIKNEKVRLVHIKKPLCHRTLILEKNPFIPRSSAQENFFNYLMDFTDKIRKNQVP